MTGNEAEIRREAFSHDKRHVKYHTFELVVILCVCVGGVIDLLLLIPSDRAVACVSVRGQQSTVQSG